MRSPCRLSYEIEGRSLTADVDRPEVVVGRSAACDLSIPSGGISRRHAVLQLREDGWHVLDLGAKNGVLVNGRRVRRARLASGDRIALGDVVLEFRTAGDVPDAQSVPVVESGGASEVRSLDMGALETMVAAAAPAARAGPGREELDGGPGARGAAELVRALLRATESLLETQDLDARLVRLADLVLEHVPAGRTVLCLLDAEGRPVPRVTRTVGDASPELVLSRTVVRATLQEKRSILVHDTTTDSLFGRAASLVEERVTSLACAPLYREGRVEGLLYADVRGPSPPLDERHLEILSVLAMLAALAVEQARLREDVSRHQRIRRRLALYNDARLVEALVADAGADLECGMRATETDVTVLFADVDGFTGIAERLPAVEVTLILNGVFDGIASVLFELDGTLDKFIGDEVMAFFGAPLPQPDHAERAVRAALRIQEALERRNEALPADRRVRVTIGINSGTAVVGDVGTPARRDYTVIGDTVNVAKRLQSLARPGEIVLGPATHARVRHVFDCEALPEAALRGRGRPVQPWRVRSPASGP